MLGLLEFIRLRVRVLIRWKAISTNQVLLLVDIKRHAPSPLRRLRKKDVHRLALHPSSAAHALNLYVAIKVVRPIVMAIKNRP